MSLNADLSAFTVMHAAEVPWQPSPSAGVLRKRLMHSGSVEGGVVTSLVRYDPGSSFSPHEHPGGEEILVLSGVFSDERGDFGAGSYMLNPEGFCHRPFSKPGCELFVKLRQYPGKQRETILIDTRAGRFESRLPGIASLWLYRSEQYPERIRITRFEPGAEARDVELAQGEELFVIDGSFEDEYGSYRAGSWLRHPAGARHSPRSAQGCTLYVRSGGFSAALVASV